MLAEGACGDFGTEIGPKNRKISIDVYLKDI
jgi:hypothetical protein